MPFIVQGWVGSQRIRWPLWCGTDPPCPMDCITSQQFWPFFVLHGVLFYGTAIVIMALKRYGHWPKHTGFDSRYDSIFYVASHIPMAVMAFPLGIMGLVSAHEIWISGDPRLQFGELRSPMINEGCVWFASYLVLDTLLVVIHGYGDKELFVHHAIFGTAAWLGAYQCALPLLGAVFVTQELSTPWLNTFMLLRAYKGLQNLWTQAMFLVFAANFYVFRVMVNSVHCVLFLREVVRGFSQPSNFTISRAAQWLFLALIVGATVLQLHWGRIITKKLYGALRKPSKSK